MLTLTEEPKDIPENYFWATKEELRTLSERGLASEHLMQCLGVESLTT
jgi:hypothetical protein